MKNITKMTVVYASVLLIVCIASCKKLSSFDMPGQPSAYDIISDDVTFSYFKNCVDRVGMQDILNGNSGQYTVFAPINSAFLNAGYTQEVLQAMPKTALEGLIKNHILPGKLSVAISGNSQELTSLSGFKFVLQKNGDYFYVDGGDITSPDAVTINGYFNVINKVLMSQNTLYDAVNNLAANNTSYSFLPEVLIRASAGSTNFTSLFEGSTAYTFLAPTNDAFIEAGYTTLAKVQTAVPDDLGNILKYHLFSGRKLTTDFDSLPVNAYNGNPVYFDKIKNSKTTYWYANGIGIGNGRLSNVLAANGVLHTAARLLPIPVAVTTLTQIQNNTDLSMFYALIQRASEADPAFNFKTMLSDPKSSYTVFAINNAGLQSLGYADVSAVNAASPQTLARLLKFHMLPKRINNINIAEGKTSTTLLKEKDAITGDEKNTAITFVIDSGFGVKGPSNVVAVPVITGNIVTTNGILNIIGTTLLP